MQATAAICRELAKVALTGPNIQLILVIAGYWCFERW
jgi:hypothetical protein